MFWLGAIVSLCYVPGLTGAYIATQWPVLAVLLPFWLLKRGKFTTYHLLGLLFVTYAAFRVPFSPVPYISVFGFWLVVIVGLCLWFGTVLEDPRKLYAGLAFGAAVSSGLTVLEKFGVHVVVSATDSAGLYVSSVQQGAIFSLIAVALVSERMWLWLLPLAPGFMLANSRGAVLALCVGLLACYVRRLWVFGIVGIAGVAWLFFLPLSSSDSERLFIWRAAWDNLTWLGLGPGVFYAIVLPRVDDGRLFFPEYVHNDALQLAVEYGIGALLALPIFAYALWRTDTKEWPVVVAFTALGSYSMPLFMPITAFLAFAAVGRILRSDAIAWRDGDHSRPDGVPGVRRHVENCGAYLSVASHRAAKG